MAWNHEIATRANTLASLSFLAQALWESLGFSSCNHSTITFSCYPFLASNFTGTRAPKATRVSQSPLPSGSPVPSPPATRGSFAGSCVSFSGSWLPLHVDCRLPLDMLLSPLPHQASQLNTHSGFCCCCNHHTPSAPSYAQAAAAALSQVSSTQPWYPVPQWQPASHFTVIISRSGEATGNS